MTYLDELRLAMQALALDPSVVFMGQAVADKGTAMSTTFEGIERSRLVEMPVAEDMQMGMAIGMSLCGFLPVCVYPRWNFLLLATNQLVLHLDKLPLYSAYRPKVIIRTAIAASEPLDPGAQHLGDFTDAYTSMFRTVHVRKLGSASQIRLEYESALSRNGSTLLVEIAAMYGR